MSRVQQLKISGFRNILSADIVELDRINLFYGENGAGKTSVLECLHLLGMGRTFRSGTKKSFINHDSDEVTVFGRVYDDDAHLRKLGVSRNNKGEVQLRLDGDKLQKLASLASLLPLQTINADSFELLAGGPGRRRRYLDWGLFHQETLFLPDWRQFQKLLKQRNHLLRHDRIDEAQLAVWDHGLVQVSERIDAARQRYIEQLKPLFLKVLFGFSPELELQVSYRRGWDKNRGLAEVLSSQRAAEIQRGYSLYGPHRADLRIKVGTHTASDVLSRGQQKIVVCALLIAQAKLLSEKAAKPCVFLIDDLPSELDAVHRKKVCDFLEQIGTQVFITGINREDLIGCWQEQHPELMLFHVEHGQITKEKA